MSIAERGSEPAAETARGSVAVLVATGFGLGRLRPAPGTWASAAAVLLAFAAAAALPPPWWRPACMAAALAAFAAGLASCGAAIRRYRDGDPSPVVADEFAGQWLTLACLPPGAGPADWRWAVAAFVAFRCFDVLKPWPVSQAERLPGGWGIMADDMVAGCLAACACYPLILVFS